MTDDVSDLVGILEDLDLDSGSIVESSGEITPSPEEVPAMSKMEQAFDLKMRGYSVQVIALTLKVDVSTVYRYLRKYREQYREQLEQEPAANLIAESLCFLQTVEQICLGEAEEIKRAKDSGKELDLATGEVKPLTDREASNLGKDRLSFIKAAQNAREKQIDLMLSTGVIPKEPEKLYAAIGQVNDTTEAEKDKLLERSEDEIKNQVLELLQRGRIL